MNYPADIFTADIEIIFAPVIDGAALIAREEREREAADEILDEIDQECPESIYDRREREAFENECRYDD